MKDKYLTTKKIHLFTLGLLITITIIILLFLLLVIGFLLLFASADESSSRYILFAIIYGLTFFQGLYFSYLIYKVFHYGIIGCNNIKKGDSSIIIIFKYLFGFTTLKIIFKNIFFYLTSLFIFLLIIYINFIY